MKTPIPASLRSNGFALVVTVSLLVLLSVIALGFLSLSAVTLRSGSQGQAQMEARANAKLALQIAIGELQKQVGPDQRITANGGILQENDGSLPDPGEIENPHWTGVWNSWKAGDGETSQHSTVEIEGEPITGMAPTYLTSRNDYFRSWLLSLSPTEAADWTSARDLILEGETQPNAGDSALRLVGPGTLGEASNEEDYVSVRLIDVMPGSPTSGFRGRYGWWIGDESQKARLMGDTYTTDTALTLAEKIGRAQAPGSTGTKTAKGLENITAAGETLLSSLSTQKSLDLVPGSRDVDVGPETVKTSEWNFHHATPFTYGVIADVREGGLKRDLSALLELPIDPAYIQDERMLYRFKSRKDKHMLNGNQWTNKPQECVPLQDLAAYYQLYDAVSPEAQAKDPVRVSSGRGIQYETHPALGGLDGLHLRSTDFGTTAQSPIYPREYSSLYRQPRIIKVQFLASLFSNRIDPPIPADRSNPQPSTHELLIGITPSITFWNPTNLPVIFQINSNPALGAQMMRYHDLPIQVRFTKTMPNGITHTSTYQTYGPLTGFNDAFFNLYWAGIHPIRLEPGEVKTLSLPYSGDLSSLKSELGYNGHWARWNSSFFFKTDTYFVGHEVKVGWEPESFILLNNSAAPDGPGGPPVKITDTDPRHVANGRLRFKASDRIRIELGSAGGGGGGWMNNASCYQDYNPLTSNWDRFNGQMGLNGGGGAFSKGMTGGAAGLVSSSRTGSSIIARSTTETGWPFMHFSQMAAVETSEASNGGIAGGRKFASRPFLHSSPVNSYPLLEGSSGNALYNFGWNWAVDLLNDVYEAPVQVTNTGSSYWGGGYTPESGTTHIIQQEIPVIPPMSIAALSHARLGGWSISDQTEMTYGEMIRSDAGIKRQLMRAIGFGGLAPNTLQAIGNSYAHPQIPASQAYINTTRTVSGVAGGTIPITFADHSYLANKALWDDYFFSSITPQMKKVEIFQTEDRKVEDVASDFFFEKEPLPNRRMTPYMANMDESELQQLISGRDLFEGGMADKIAAHLMVEGPFNINSTSVEAWKIFFSSLKGKPVAYLDKTTAMAGGDPLLATDHTGTPVGQMGLGGGVPYTGSPDDPGDPEQWTSTRVLTDEEIEELATAMVEQVKLRGPFLSLSEFVNRRLDSTNLDLAVKGALQAALDDEDVSINEAFRGNERKFSGAELASMTPAFAKAAEGPIAYGSSAYVDQADVLRGFAEQLTPRGDTFVIRTYGDSIDASGNVVARAWCEAVVQRLPDYVDPLNPEVSSDTGDLPETKQADLDSETNKNYGRKLQMISFRWLDASEI